MSALHDHTLISVLLAVVPLIGVALAWLLFQRGRLGSAAWGQIQAPPLVSFWRQGWAFDQLYAGLLVKPYVALATLNKNDIVDSFYHGITQLAQWLHFQVSHTQTGNVRWYAGAMVIGLTFVIAAGVFL